MQFHHDNSRAKHDRSRGMIGERSRDHFMAEQREKKHELETNRELIRKALNDGYEYDNSTRLNEGYAVRFLNRQTGDARIFKFQYEANYVRLESFWWKRH